MNDKKTSFNNPVTDRMVGAVIGLMVGDALGMPVEGWSRQMIVEHFGWLDNMVEGRLPAGHYTDDFQMALGLLESLIDESGFDPQICANRWAANFEAQRGYGGRIQSIMNRLRAGDRWNEVGGDSFGNGSAMRIGPLGAFWANDPKTLERMAVESSIITHQHPEAVAGAVVVALAVGQAFRLGLSGEAIKFDSFLEPLIETAKRYDIGFGRRLAELKSLAPTCQETLADQISQLYGCNLKAIESVPPALACVLFTTSFEESVGVAVNLGGDTDTIGAITGSIAAALYGATTIPDRWWTMLENSPGSGRDYAVELAVRVSGIRPS